MIKSSIILFFSFLTLLVFAQEEVQETKDVEVILGIDKVIKLDFVPHTSVQVGQPELLSYKIAPAKKEVILQGLKPGTSSLLIRDASTNDIRVRYNVTITATDQSKILKELQELIGDVEGLEIGVKADKVYVGGQLVVPSDIGRVVVVLEKYPDVMKLLELSSQTQRMIATKMQEEIQKNGMNDVTVRVVNGLFWLEGVVPSPQHEQKAFQIAKAYLPAMIESLALQSERVKQLERDIIQNFLVVDKKITPQPLKKLIKLTAQFVELSKNYGKTFAFKWTPILAGDGGSIGIGKTSDGGIGANSSGGGLAATISGLFPKLASAKSAGYARILQSGMLLTQDGIKGSITKKVKTPYQIGSGEFTQGKEAESGFTLNITPAILQQEMIQLDLGISVSSAAGSSAPEVISNDIQTNIIVKNKDSAAVGGVVINKSTTDYDKTTPYGENSKTDSTSSSPLFSFVKSKEYLISRNQFVVFVTPEIVESASIATEEIKQKFRKRER